MTQEVQITVENRLHALIELHAQINGMTNDEAASDLVKQAIAAKYKKACNRAPATVYQFKPKGKAA